MNTTVEAIGTIILGVLALAGVAIVVSKNSNSSSVIASGATGLSNLITVALSPVSGATPGSYSTSTSLPY